MKKLLYLLFLIPLGIGTAFLNPAEEDLFADFIAGDAKIQSINALAFGPEGVLFIGDSKSASITAVKTDDTTPVESSEEINITGFDRKIAEALGTDPSGMTIQDMAVNPISKSLYFGVHMADGTPVLLRLEKGEFKHVDLSNISYSNTGIQNVPDVGATNSRGRDIRVWAVSDLQYHNGSVLVTGLSNQEFGSTFRKIDFPFKDKQNDSSLEIYHGAHGQYETHSPIKTFTVTELKGKEYLVASYTCTPLVLFPMEELKAGKHVKGRTVAELGFGNSPLDMITMEKEGQKFLVMNNSRRPVMTIKYENLEKYEGSLSSPIETTAGVDHFNLPMVLVQQMDKLDDNQFVMLQRQPDGDLRLWSSTVRWL